jgi:hypothetical protein
LCCVRVQGRVSRWPLRLMVIPQPKSVPRTHLRWWWHPMFALLGCGVRWLLDVGATVRRWRHCSKLVAGWLPGWRGRRGGRWGARIAPRNRHRAHGVGARYPRVVLLQEGRYQCKLPDKDMHCLF